MSANPQLDEIVGLPVSPAPAEPTNGHQLEIAPSEPQAAPAATQTASALEQVGPVEQVLVPARPKRDRPAWRASISVGAVAILAAGTLGYDAYSAAAQRDGLYKMLVTTTATLGSTEGQLASAQADARSKKVTADYVAMYLADSGRIQTDYQTLNSCNSFGSCRTASQQLLDDLQKFQSDRSAATVPGIVSAGDASLGDALSAAIAADREIISGMDSGNVNKFEDGFKKLNAAMLNVGKAEAALGAQVK